MLNQSTVIFFHNFSLYNLLSFLYIIFAFFPTYLYPFLNRVSIQGCNNLISVLPAFYTILTYPSILLLATLLLKSPIILLADLHTLLQFTVGLHPSVKKTPKSFISFTFPISFPSI